MSFDEVQFPVNISAGASGGPVFKTDVIVVHDGYERRNQNWSQGRVSYDASYGIRGMADISTVLKFFRARGGMVRGFRFRDPLDYTSAFNGVAAYSATDQLLGIGNDVQTTFQLVKNYTSGGVTQRRLIKKPVAGKFLVAVNGYEQKFGAWTGRTTTALYVNSAGILTTAAIDAMRWAYDPVTLLPVGLIVEPAKNNLTNYSNGAASWSRTATNINLGAATSPDGTSNASALEETTAASGHYILESGSVTWVANTTYTQSIYLKADTATIAQITFPSGAFSNTPYANFNLIAGTVTANVNCTAGILNAGNGWYRCYITAAATTPGLNKGNILVLVNNNPAGTRLQSYTGTSKKLFMYGAQIEIGGLTSLIPTNGSDGFRDADVTTWLAGTQYEETLHQPTLDSTTGIVTLLQAPANGIEVRAGYEFDIPARFDSDNLDVKLAYVANGQFSVPIKEILI